MDQSIDSPLPGSISCCYYNEQNFPEVIRIVNIADCHFERTVLPQTMLRFEAPPDAILEVRSPRNVSTIKADKISCRRLENPPEESE